ncbi:MAG TPA: bis(5'-nucleosyl)-tetraphosphatase (symmetrical) YqeK [Bacillales bacterium]|nr:bis(5'-nucleosyl)-tetraphosphatase (symmetrical) YqeK [Bacillales bacterium]
MDRETALEIVKPQLTQRRYEHTVRVTDTALDLAEIYSVDRDKTEIAGILHDYAKFRPKEEMAHLIEEEGSLPDELLSYHIELWHAPVGAVLVEKETGISDPDVLGAIRYHTTGRDGMSQLEKVIFLADYIEPGRDFPGVDHVRELAKNDLDGAVVQALVNTITFLMKKKAKVHPDTLAAYNSLV